MLEINSSSLRSLLTTVETQERRARARPTVFFASIVLCMAFAGCGSDAPKTARTYDAPQEAVSQIGDVTIRANVLPTASLSEAVAKQYGIAREDNRVMLLISVRQGAENQDVALPATIDATVSNLQGQRRTLEMRELRTGDYVDYIGTTTFTPPDTLRFDVEIEREGGVRSTMTFSRDFAGR